jgi:hypothetical protein
MVSSGQHTSLLFRLLIFISVRSVDVPLRESFTFLRRVVPSGHSLPESNLAAAQLYQASVRPRVASRMFRLESRPRCDVAAAPRIVHVAAVPRFSPHLHSVEASRSCRSFRVPAAFSSRSSDFYVMFEPYCCCSRTCTSHACARIFPLDFTTVPVTMCISPFL